MAEITYLLGAGASFGALPIVNMMAEKVVAAKNWLNTNYKTYSIPNKYSTADAKKFHDVISDLQWLAEICDTERNFSVDTYARKLDLSGNRKDYIKLKNILSFYFTLEQRRNPPDIRYDNFWASILKSRTVFPDNLKIISWNYDFQLELTYQGFFGHDSLRVARETLNVSSREADLTDLGDSGKFGVYKLNGSATFNSNTIEDRNSNYIVDDFNTSRIDDFIIRLVEIYEKLSTKPTMYINHLSFAWEHKTDSAFYKHLQEAIKNTQILVVIGYSFPFFNREIDKLILSEFMKNKLYKVYFQAPPDDVQDVRERFLAINNKIDPNNLILRSDIKQFTLPNEL